jgi:hypothetical protein
MTPWTEDQPVARPLPTHRHQCRITHTRGNKQWTPNSRPVHAASVMCQNAGLKASKARNTHSEKNVVRFLPYDLLFTLERPNTFLCSSTVVLWMSHVVTKTTLYILLLDAT